jgi:hypothetical protein
MANNALYNHSAPSKSTEKVVKVREIYLKVLKIEQLQ